MTTSLSGLRQIAYSYCRIVSQLFKFIGFDGYQIGLIFGLIAALCSIALLGNGRARAVVNRFCPPWLYCLLLIVALFIARLPTFLPGPVHPDEPVFLAGAMKLRHYPVFWQSVDGTTSGPLNYFALTFLNLLGLPLGFPTARLLNIICIGGAITVVYCIARLFMPDWAARLTPLPPLAATMAFRNFELLHYSSECVSVLLIALGTWLICAEALSDRPNWLRGVGIGIIAALLPFAKLQSAPMAMTVAVGGMAQIFVGHKKHRWREVLYVSAGLAAVIASLLLFLKAFGVFGAFQQSYIVSNWGYASSGYMPPSLEKFLQFCVFPDLQWYEGGILACLLYVLGSPYYPWMRRGNRKAAWKQFSKMTVIATLLYGAVAWWWNNIGGLTWGIILAFLFTGLALGTIRTLIQRRSVDSFCDLFVFLNLAASAYAVYRPRREYAHYLVFLIFPLAMVGVRTLAWSLRTTKNMWGSSSNPAVSLSAIPFVLFTLALPCLVRSGELRPAFGSETWMATYPVYFESAASVLLKHFAKPGDPVAIWGWAPELYVSTGTLPATRDLVPSQLASSPQQGYYRRRYIEDLELHPPKVFLDAVGPGEFMYQNRDAFGFETFPELRKYVTSNFYFAGDVANERPYVSVAANGVRVFVRRDANHQMKLPFRIKCGSAVAVSDEAGNEWKPDIYFRGGQSRQLAQRAAVEELPAIYRSEHSCAANCQYVIPIENGSYLVRMYFAELDHSGANQRLFDVAVNEDGLALDLDVFRAAQGRAKPYVLERRTTVSEEAIVISLVPTLGEATLSGIEILPPPEIAPSNFQLKEMAENEAGPLINGVQWKTEPAWTLNSHHRDVGNLSTGEMWSSYGGDDTKTGRIISGPLTPRSTGCLVVPVAHGPSVDRLSVALFDIASGQLIGMVPVDTDRRRWQLYEVRYDPALTVRLVADDLGIAWGQWLAVGQPRSCK